MNQYKELNNLIDDLHAEELRALIRTQFDTVPEKYRPLVLDQIEEFRNDIMA